MAQQSVSTQLGLIQYGQGFYHPVQIRFDDGAPAISENPFFYVLVHSGPSDGGSDEDGFRQELVVNVEAFARKRKEASWKDPDLRNGFYYAMTQLVLNDIAGGRSEKVLPGWVQEGLAVYLSGSGEQRVRDVAARTRRSQVSNLVGELNRPYPYLTGRQWARYYLAIKYIYDTGGINSLQGFVREMVDGTSAADAVLHTLSQEWPDFQKNVKAYTVNALASSAPNDDDPRFRNGTLIPDLENSPETR